MKKGQASVEYIMVLGIFLVIVIPLFYFAIAESSQRISAHQGGDLVQSLATAADEVYSLSPGTKKFVWVSMPGNVEGVFITGNEITVTASSSQGPSDFVAFTQAPVTGSLDPGKGTYRVPVEHLPSGVVLIGEGNDSSPPNVVWTGPSGITCNPVVLRAQTDEAARCNYDLVDAGYSSMAFSMKGTAIGHSAELGVVEANDYTYYVRCTDAFGNTMNTSAQINYQVNVTNCPDGWDGNETDQPIVTAISPADGFFAVNSRNNFTYNVSDGAPILLCDLIVDNQTISTVYTPERNVPNTIVGDLDFGYHNWSVHCTDAWNNRGNSTPRLIEVNASLDGDAPVVLTRSPANGSIRSYSVVRFFYNASDATSAIDRCTIEADGELDDGDRSNSVSTDFTVPEDTESIFTLSLDKGNYTWNITCIDDSVYSTKGVSTTLNFRINVSDNSSFLTSCAGVCGNLGYASGSCRQNVAQCTQVGDVYEEDGDEYCTGGTQADTCCCIP